MVVLIICLILISLIPIGYLTGKRGGDWPAIY
jgi:hypothetical protein